MPALENAKHEAFARAIVEGKSGREAYKAAGYPAKAAAADANASRLLKNAKVAARVAELKDKAADGAVMTAHQVLLGLSRLAGANMLDYMRPGPDGDPVLDFSQLTREQAECLSEVTVEKYMDGGGDDAREVKRVKFKLCDKRGALVDLGRHHGLFKDKSEVEHGGKIALEVRWRDPEDK